MSREKERDLEYFNKLISTYEQGIEWHRKLMKSNEKPHLLEWHKEQIIWYKKRIKWCMEMIAFCESNIY